MVLNQPMQKLWIILKNQAIKEYRQSPLLFWAVIGGSIVIGAFYGIVKAVGSQ